MVTFYHIIWHISEIYANFEEISILLINNYLSQCMSNSKFYLSCVAILALSTTFIACDNSYDLSKDINTDINVGSNFQIPVGKTDTIFLKRIIKPGDNLTVNNSGIYEISTNGNFNSKTDVINTVSVTGLDPIFRDIVIPLNNSSRTRAITGTINTNFENTSSYTVDVKLPTEVKSLSYAQFSANGSAPVNTSISISINNFPAGVDEISFKGMKIEFPEIFMVGSNNSHIVNVADFSVKKSSNANSAKIDIPIQGISIPSNLEDKYIVHRSDGNAYLVINADLKISSNISIPYDQSQINASSITLKFAYDVPPTSITKVGGTLVPNVNIDEYLALNDLPDFIKDQNSSFVPNNVVFNLLITNPIEMPLSTDIYIAPATASGTISDGTKVKIPLTNIPPSSTTNYVISNKEQSVGAGQINVICPELPSLFKKVPDGFAITTDKITASSNNNQQSISLGRDYTINGDYNINIPFSFSNLKILYTDSIDDLVSDLKDVSNKTNYIAVTAKALNTIPTELQISVKLHDINGNELNGIEVNLTKFIIAPATDGQGKESDLEIILKEKDNSKDLELLDKIVYTVSATALDGQTNLDLKPTQYLIIKNILAKLPKGLTITL